VYLIPFHRVEPDLAADEMRFMQTFDERDGLPAGRYYLVEHYCPDPDCDCRRVMLTVVREDRPNRSLASINYAFDGDDPLPGPFLDRINPQSGHAEVLLDMVSRAVLTDQRYLDRLESHYALVKEAASDPDHPAHADLQELAHNEPEDVAHRPAATRSNLVGRNDPCPCGSGKKYKHCCMLKDR
jgi:hypothetical protein